MIGILLHCRDWAALAVFVGTLFVVATGRMPGSRLDRTGAALLGAALMVALGVLPLAAAYRAIDWNTIALLLGMMIVVAYLKAGGLFVRLTGWVGRRVHRPAALMALVALVSAVASAFLVNDTVCLILAPLVLDLTLGMKRDPVPYLLAVATGANIGSVATITGNPQNIMIGSFSGIGYGRFAEMLTPIAVIGLVLALGLIAAFYRRELFGARLDPVPQRRRRPPHPRLALWVCLVLAAMILSFFLVAPVALPAIVAAAILLLTPGIKPARIYREIDWPLLVLFCGLFVVVAGAEKVLLTPALLREVAGLPLGQVPVLALVSAVLSNLVSNVPAVLVLRPFVAHLPHQETAWLTLAASSTLAGNLTILGSVANLIVVQKAAARHVTIGFWTYFKLGAPLTVLSLVAAVAVLMLR